MAARGDEVTATFVDERTIECEGRLYALLADEDEVLLQPMDGTVAPRLRCSCCGYERVYHYWYRDLGYQKRVVNYCPGCGHHIMGVMGDGR